MAEMVRVLSELAILLKRFRIAVSAVSWIAAMYIWALVSKHEESCGDLETDMNDGHCVGRDELSDQADTTMVCGHLCFQIGEIVLIATATTAAGELGRRCY
jgi:hypothetical protein